MSSMSEVTQADRDAEWEVWASKFVFVGRGALGDARAGFDAGYAAAQRCAQEAPVKHSLASEDADDVERVARAIAEAEEIPASWVEKRWHEYAADARAAIAAMRPDQQWQPIETAPKDGTWVDLWVGGGRMTDCAFLGGFWQAPVNPGPEDDVSDLVWFPGFGHGSAITRGGGPTHWMPLPPAPLAAHEQGGE